MKKPFWCSTKASLLVWLAFLWLSNCPVLDSENDLGTIKTL